MTGKSDIDRWDILHMISQTTETIITIYTNRECIGTFLLLRHVTGHPQFEGGEVQFGLRFQEIQFMIHWYQGRNIKVRGCGEAQLFSSLQLVKRAEKQCQEGRAGSR